MRSVWVLLAAVALLVAVVFLAVVGAGALVTFAGIAVAAGALWRMHRQVDRP